MSNITPATTASPPRQTMERIPSSVFASKPSNNPDWLHASTEADSLFSITIRSYQPGLLDYKSRLSQNEATNSDANAMGSQTEADFLELKLEDTAGVGASEPTMEENVDEKVEEDEERTSPRVISECTVSETIREDKASPVERDTDLSTSYAIRLEAKTGHPRNNHPKITEIEIVEEEAQPQTVDQAPNASSEGWFSCFHGRFSWKLVCC